MSQKSVSPGRVLLPVGLGTALSLLGDTSLYAVLPTHFEEAAISLAAVGVMLSANRFIRLALNGPIGVWYDHAPRRALFVPALFVGAVSTAMYAFTQGFWPLLAARLLWGIAWVGIWVGGNTIILDISRPDNRGRWVGFYQTAFFLGASSGAILGGWLTDWLGYHQAMAINASLTLVGALFALLLLPETRGLSAAPFRVSPANPLETTQLGWRHPKLLSAIGLLGVNRLVLAGTLLPTLGLFLLQYLGESVTLAGLTLGVATITGLALGANSLIAMVASPLVGSLSDRLGRRWPVAAAGLLPGIVGFGLLALTSPLSLLIAIPCTAVSGASNQSLATALVGDLSGDAQRGQRLGVMFTVGDLASAVGPLLAYALIPRLGINGVYLLAGLLLAAMFGVALRWSRQERHSHAPVV